MAGPHQTPEARPMPWAWRVVLAVGVSAAVAGAVFSVSRAGAQTPSGTPSEEPTTGPATGPGPTPEPPPPTPGPDGSPSPFPTVLLTPPTATEPPEIDAPSAVLMDVRTGQILFARSPDDQRPIASTTKIMTALLVVQGADREETVIVSESAAAQPGSAAELLPGEMISVEELLYALLLSSANDAAVALAEHVSGDVAAFVAEMNTEADRLGLARTLFTSPTGLDDAGVSTARNLAQLTRRVYRRPQPPGAGVIAGVAGTKFHELPPAAGEVRRLQNRNALLWLYPGAVGVKTGMTPGAGFSLVAVAERAGRRLIAVVLGGEDEVFSEAAAVLNFGFDGFEERVLVEEGEVVEEIEAAEEEGAGPPVPVLAARSLSRLVPVVDGDRVTRDVRCCGEPGMPYDPGDRAGTLLVRLDGVVIGRVPLVVGEPPPPSPAEAGPPVGSARVDVWWPVVVAALLLAALAAALALFRALFRRSP